MNCSNDPSRRAAAERSRRSLKDKLAVDSSPRRWDACVRFEQKHRAVDRGAPVGPHEFRTSHKLFGVITHYTRTASRMTQSSTDPQASVQNSNGRHTGRDSHSQARQSLPTTAESARR